MSNEIYTFRVTDLKPVGQLAVRNGWKACCFGGPGTGKTPFLMTAAPMSPVHCFVETGIASVRNVMDQPGYVFSNYASVRDYWLWATRSQEATRFGLKTMDSMSQLSTMVLNEDKYILGHDKDGKPKTYDPRKAYGNMIEKVMEIMHWIYYAPNFYALLLAKEIKTEIEGQGTKYRPQLEGNALDSMIPHLFDSFWRLERVSDGKGGLVRVIRTVETSLAFARDRSGNLAELETPDVASLFTKVMQ